MGIAVPTWITSKPDIETPFHIDGPVSKSND